MTSPGLRPGSPPANGEPLVLAGRYTVEETIGRGGMATVYLARDRVLDRPVALKLLHESLSREPRFVEQFLDMERRIARLFHPHLVTIYDVGLAEAGCYVVMEYVPGGSLRERLTAAGRFEVPEVVRIVAQVADALESLHQERIIHGDIKPDNILIGDDGEAKLVDFGIARLATTSRALPADSLGGSAPYLAPEQLQSEQANPRSDVYALGLVAYELLAGRPAFGGDNWVAVAAARLVRDPEPLRGTRPDLPLALERVVQRATARDPDARFASAAALRRALLDLEQEFAPPLPLPRPGAAEPGELGAVKPEPTRPSDPGLAPLGLAIRRATLVFRRVLLGRHPAARPLLMAALGLDVLLLILIVLR